MWSELTVEFKSSKTIYDPTIRKEITPKKLEKYSNKNGGKKGSNSSEIVLIFMLQNLKFKLNFTFNDRS
jgi:hypothetical protein